MQYQGYREILSYNIEQNRPRIEVETTYFYTLISCFGMQA